MIMTAFRLGIAELRHRPRQLLLMSGVLAVSILGVLALDAFQRGIARRYDSADAGWLVAQSVGAMGEIAGSRLGPDVGVQLASGGASLVVPEIHTIVGTSAANARLIRGVELDSYQVTESFRVVDGRPLRAGDQPRLAMVGVALAEKEDLLPGAAITLRGRQFLVAGVFTEGSYADFEVWVSLADAQRLLGWGSDVSLYLLRAGERWRAGDTLPGGVRIVPRGQAAQIVSAEWQPLLNLMRMVVAALAVASAIALTNMLWRLAWLRKRQLAILRSLGFHRRSLIAYLLAQALAVATLAYLFGLGGAMLFTARATVQATGVTIDPQIGPAGALVGAIASAAIALLAALLPAWWLVGTDLQTMLRSDV